MIGTSPVTPEGMLRAAALAAACAALVTGLLVGGARPARAIETETFRLEPHPLRVAGYERRTFDFDVEPGATVTDAVRITNTTDRTRTFRLHARDAQRDAQTGAVAVGSRGSDPVGMGTWIDLTATELDVPPHSSRIVGFTFHRPEGEETSGFGAIVAEELRETTGPGVDVVHRLALLVDVGGRSPDLHVTQPHLDIPLALVPDDGGVSTTITNDTLSLVRASVRFSVTSITGRTWTMDAIEIALDPGEVREVRSSWTSVPRWGGVLRPSVGVTWDRGSYASNGSRGLYPPLWLLALAIVAVGVRGLREMRARWQEGRTPAPERRAPAPDAAALRERLIEAALWLHSAGRDAPTELRERTIAETRAIAARARHTPNASDIERAARALEAFVRGLDSGDVSTRRAASDFDTWFRQHRAETRVKELVSS